MQGQGIDHYDQHAQEWGWGVGGVGWGVGGGGGGVGGGGGGVGGVGGGGGGVELILSFSKPEKKN